MIFTVIGNIHPPKRVIAYLKYIPLKTETFQRILKEYTMRDLEYTLQYLSEVAPYHLYQNEVMYFEFSAPLKLNIKTHYIPEDHLTKILYHERDELEEKAKDLVHLLSDESGVSIDNFGVTGSILLGIHNIRFSDVDLTVYGRKAAQKVLKKISELQEEKDKGLTGFNYSTLQRFFTERGRDSNLTFKEYKHTYNRLRNRGIFQKTFFSIHPVKLESENEQTYGSQVYKRVGVAVAEGVVSDTKDSIFYPATYYLEESTILKGIEVEEIKEIVSYDGLYCGIANTGEKLKVKGIIEEVSTQKKKWYRMVVGSRRSSDFIRIQ
jgi:predicted nucleotidyltransferase